VSVPGVRVIAPVDPGRPEIDLDQRGVHSRQRPLTTSQTYRLQDPSAQEGSDKFIHALSPNQTTMPYRLFTAYSSHGEGTAPEKVLGM
jgi:hypothetical protein